MDRRSWIGYQPAAVERARRGAQAAFEEELDRLHAEEVALRDRVLHLRAEEERLITVLSDVEREEERLRTALTGAIDRESTQLQTITETYAQEVQEQRGRIADLQAERERVLRVEGALITAVKGALMRHSLQEGERP